MTRTAIRFALAACMVAALFFPALPNAQASPENSTITYTWQKISNGLPAYTHIQSLVADPTDAQTMYGGFYNEYGTVKGVYKTTDAGQHWLAAATGLPAAANITSLVMDPTNALILYAINGQDELYKSSDGGGNWAKLTALPDDVWCVAVYGSVIYVGGYSTIYLSTDGGSTFNPTFSYPGSGTMNSMWIDPGNSAHVIAAWGSSLSQTTNSGHSWNAYTLSGCDTAYTVVLAVDPLNPQHIMVGTWTCILRSLNGGASWTNVRNLGHVNFIRYDPMDDKVVYASSDSLGPSLFLKSADGGSTWSNFDSGLPASYQVAAMDVGPSSQAGATHSTVYAGISGSGVYKNVISMPPGVPALLAPANNALITDTDIRLDWRDATYADHYRLQVAGDSTFAPASTFVDKSDIAASEFTVPGWLYPNGKYYWRVLSFNIIGTASAWSAVRTFRTALPAPANLVEDGSAQNLRPSLSWDIPDFFLGPSATGYTVQISTDSTKFSPIINTGTVTGNRYIPGVDLPRGLTLYWRVRANGANGPSAWSDQGTYTTGNPPGIPSLLAPANKALVASYTPTLSWSQPTLPGSTTFKSYRVEIATDAGFGSIARSAELVTAITDRSWVTPALAPNTTFYWHVQACNTGNECSAWSASRTFRTKLSPPVAIGPIGPAGSTKPTFSWSAVPGASGYTLQVSRFTTFTPLLLNVTVAGASTTSYTPGSALPAGSTLYWQVRANGANGPSDWMAYATFTTP